MPWNKRVEQIARGMLKSNSYQRDTGDEWVRLLTVHVMAKCTYADSFFFITIIIFFFFLILDSVEQITRFWEQ